MPRLPRRAGCSFPRSSLLGLIKANPDLALNMLGILAQRLRRFSAAD